MVFGVNRSHFGEQYYEVTARCPFSANSKVLDELEALRHNLKQLNLSAEGIQALAGEIERIAATVFVPAEVWSVFFHILTHLKWQSFLLLAITTIKQYHPALNFQ